jgi:hypothetical protein
MAILYRRLGLEHLEQRDVPSANPAIGMNLEHIADWSPAWMFTDAFKASRPWMPEVYNAATGQVTPDVNHTLPLTLDSKGWPLALSQGTNAQGQHLYQLLDTVMFDGLQGAYAPGVYTAQWDGTGTLQWGGDAMVLGTSTTPAGDHRALLQVTPGNQGIRLRLTTESTADPLRNFHVWMPDYNGQSFVGQVWQPGANFSPFHPLFLQRLSPFHTLRFMQEEDTITTQVQHWSDRRPWDYETQMSAWFTFQNGIAPEYMVELCNELKADLWTNVPHTAQDDFIINDAVFIRNHLNPGLKVYVEWSNEVWNRAPGFMPYQWVIQQLALPQNAGLNFYQFVAQENRHTFDIFSQVFAGQTSRLVRTVGVFEESPGYAVRLLSYMNGDFDAISPAAYFGSTSAQIATYNAGTTVDQVIADTASSIPTDLNFLQLHRQIADSYSAQLGRHIQLVAYEGGLSLIGNNQPYQPTFVAAEKDPRVYGLYRQFLIGARQMGLELFTNFEFTDRDINTPYGVFGALTRMDMPVAQAPKYRALLDAVSGVLYLGPTAPQARTEQPGAAGDVESPEQPALHTPPGPVTPARPRGRTASAQPSAVEPPTP